VWQGKNLSKCRKGCKKLENKLNSYNSKEVNRIKHGKLSLITNKYKLKFCKKNY
jgi:hypothetical protein